MDANAHFLALHHDWPDAPGTEPGDECGRWLPADEDCPKPWRCGGTITDEHTCDTRGERA